MTYAEKLKDQRWQQKRLELLNNCGWKCQDSLCRNENPKPTLHVHHRFYKRATDPWDYPDFTYQVLCEECHISQQSSMEIAHEMLAKHPDILHALVLVSTSSSPNQEAFSSLVSSLFVHRSNHFESLLIALSAVVKCHSRSFAVGYDAASDHYRNIPK